MNLSLKTAAFSLSVILEVLNQDWFEEAVIEWLISRGWDVLKRTEWETPKEFSTRLGISAGMLTKRLQHPLCPKHDSVKGESGRVRYIAPNAALENFCKGDK